ncbi:lipoprotein [Spiroplasma endosymbiont of Polydrusus formosus]|uniref:lipoprotein n=1 Tax=Spiroplasma endosymbiont of Polydrusus formosus TaxID=3139326 RepID=UPI0035B50541
MSIEFDKKGETDIKKILSILGTIGLTATSTTSLIACNKFKPDNNSENGEIINQNLHHNHNNR